RNPDAKLAHRNGGTVKLQERARAAAVEQAIILTGKQSEAGPAGAEERRLGKGGEPSAGQGLTESGGEGFRNETGPRHQTGLRDEVATPVGGPDVELTGAVAPGKLIAGCRLHRPKRNPDAKLAHRNGGTVKLQERARAAAVEQAIILTGKQSEAGPE